MSKNFKLLAENIAKFLAPAAQIELYGKNKKLIYCLNRLFSEPIQISESNEVAYIALKKNRTAKAIKIPLDKEHTLHIISDTSVLSSMQNFLNQYLQHETHIPNSHWHDQVKHFLNKYCESNNTTIHALTGKERRKLIQYLYENDVFKYQDSANYLAEKLNVSRATIYNYLNQATQLKSIFVHQVDSFTDEPFSGNPAGVVLGADKIDESLMKKIAREMNLSETAFVFKSKKADIKLRHFTPTGHEVKFCGHSTVGALYMLAHEKQMGIDKPGKYPLTIETLAGIIPAEIDLGKDESIEIQLETPKIDYIPTKISHQQIAAALGIDIDSIDTTKPVRYEKTNQDIYVTIKSLKQLEQIKINNKTAKSFAEKHHIVVYCLLCDETISKQNQIHTRCFAPAVGISEDPFTGSVLGGLAAYLIENKLIDPKSKNVRIEQGHFIDRPGFVEVKLNKKHGKLVPLIVAKARHFFSTEIQL